MNAYEAARLIDISAVRTHHGLKDIQEVVDIAKKYKFINVHALPSWTKTVAKLLKDEPDIYVGGPCTEIKVMEAKRLIEDGAQEIDVVMNVGKLKSGEYDYVENELKEVLSVIPSNILTKVIIEINCLTDEEMLKACELVIASGADFVKTGTGWVPAPLDLERIRKIKDFTRGKIKLKVAGGIRTKEDFLAMVDMGVERFGIGTKSALEIVQSFE